MLAGVLLLLAVPAAAGGTWPARTVVVPRIAGTVDVIAAYGRLRRLGLGMAIPRPFSIGSLCVPRAGAQWPRTGARVGRGATVTVRTLVCAPASPAGGDQRMVVPDIRGQLASRATGWAAAHGLYWQLARVPPLRASRRAGLLDNYVVTDQSPAAGALLARGVDCSTGERPCFRVTPLRMHVRPARG
jgi:hypothetical protein